MLDLLGKAAGTVVTGLAGVSAYEVLKKTVGPAPVRRAAVTATGWGLRAARRAEAVAEQARLTVADVLAEAIERVEEEGPRPTVAESAQTMATEADDVDH